MSSEERQIALKALGERIRKLREEKNIKQTKIAYSIGKDRQCISRLELGQINSGYLYLLQICQGLDIQPDKLLAGLTK
jgi:putative transcriptional regulator